MIDPVIKLLYLYALMPNVTHVYDKDDDNLPPDIYVTHRKLKDAITDNDGEWNATGASVKDVNRFLKKYLI